MICYIPTKDRQKTATYKLFEKVDIPVLHFIEPQDYESYKVPNKINIGENDKGISYVRNFMLDYAKKNNHNWVIMCDDDVKRFGIYNGKTKPTDASIWFDILNKAKKLPFEVYGINYVQYAWASKQSYNINKSFIEVCVLINIGKIKWRYAEGMKQDREFCLEAIKNGTGIVKFNHYWHDSPKVGTNKGGLHKSYVNKEDTKAANRLVRKYYPYAKIVNKDGRIEAKIDIKNYALSLQKPVK